MTQPTNYRSAKPPSASRGNIPGETVASYSLDPIRIIAKDNTTGHTNQKRKICLARVAEAKSVEKTKSKQFTEFSPEPF
jgi:hypothetical protein